MEDGMSIARVIEEIVTMLMRKYSPSKCAQRSRRWKEEDLGKGIWKIEYRA